MDINTLTPEQKAALKEQLHDEERAEKQAKSTAIETYKKIVSDTVTESFPHLENLSAALAACKSLIRDNFAAVIDMKTELYGTKIGQQSHQFMNDDGTLRIKIGYNVTDNYDDTVNAGIEKVRDYISSFANDERSQMLVDTVMKLLARDNKGTIKASRVLQLQQMADKSDSESFKEGVCIIRDAYKPVESKSYIRAEFKNSLGTWVSVPLGITEAE